MIHKLCEEYKESYCGLLNPTDFKYTTKNEEEVTCKDCLKNMQIESEVNE